LFLAAACLTFAGCKRTPSYCNQDLSGQWLNSSNDHFAYQFRDDGGVVTGDFRPRDEDGGLGKAEEPITFDPLPKQSVRTALILDRFSANCPIVYCSNDSFLSTTVVMGRSFFDFVTKKDESLVRSWIDAVKGWGVNERGQPSDGGFGFGKFHLFVQGRDSRCIVPSHFALKIAHVCSATDILNLRHHETAIVQHITQRREDILALHHLRPADPVFEIHGCL